MILKVAYLFSWVPIGRHEQTGRRSRLKLAEMKSNYYGSFLFFFDKFLIVSNIFNPSIFVCSLYSLCSHYFLYLSHFCPSHL